MSKKLRILSPKVWLFGKIRLKISFRSKIEGKSDSQDFFFEIQSNRNTECITRIKPETRNDGLWKTRPDTRMLKPDPTRNPRKVYPLMPYYLVLGLKICPSKLMNFLGIFGNLQYVQLAENESSLILVARSKQSASKAKRVAVATKSLVKLIITDLRSTSKSATDLWLDSIIGKV